MRGLKWRGRRGDTIRNVEIQTGELRVTNWRTDLRECNWRCRVGFTAVPKATKRRRNEKVKEVDEGETAGGRAVGDEVCTDLHKASDTRTCKTPLVEFEKKKGEKTRRSGVLVNAKAQRKERSCPDPCIVCIPS